MVLIAPGLPGTTLSSPMEEAAAAGGGDHAGVGLSRRQLRILRRIERDLAYSDPRLKDFFLLFSSGFRGCEMPQVERLPRWPARLWNWDNP